MRQIPAKAAARSCQRKLSGWKRYKGKCAWQVLRDRTNRRYQWAKPFHCRLCRKDVSFLAHGHNEVLRQFKGSRLFARDQRLRSWVALARFSRKSFEREWAGVTERKDQEGPLVRDCEHAFAEDLITNGAGVVYPQLPVVTKVSCLVDALKMGGSGAFAEKLWAQLVLTTGRVNTEVA